ncbi:hypothetical protein Lfu02_67730 [Longispora fulva]|uniref:Uncharacterized protein n=1 Tax=Longispora fulva TaxID=619741 RepID=A0A8J7GUP9_9ACTN|nr:hypothetical protein [Longispora fulva]MBG6138493.1 hypothetical protein [Longispora fulva]GIG62401.1 hypothetical protein Lfu02_67730 [Longispora fulva]
MNDKTSRQSYDSTVDTEPFPGGAPTTEHKRRSEHSTEPAEGPDEPEYTGEEPSRQR